jgi:hypothetical protein
MTQQCGPAVTEQPVIVDAHVAYAVRTVHAVCCLAGSASFIADVRASMRRHGISRAVTNHDTPAIFDWLVEAVSYQGIADTLAADYIARHGTVRWRDIADALTRRPTCPKLGGYWLFDDCAYQKASGTCREPRHMLACPLPHHPLRNGRLNQTAYSLFLFMRDVADGDFVAWIDDQVGSVPSTADNRSSLVGEAIVGPLRHVFGVGDKVLAMALSSLLMGARQRRGMWFDVGAALVAVDTLVHNFLHRTGILQRLSADHAYGQACYQPGGCAAIIRLMATHIDAREYNSTFPAVFPRFVQTAIWAYCAQHGLDICNGNRIDDTSRCGYGHCQLFCRCDRVPLRPKSQKITSFQ